MANKRPDPDNLNYDEESGMFVDQETGSRYYDSEGNDSFDD